MSIIITPVKHMTLFSAKHSPTLKITLENNSRRRHVSIEEKSVSEKVPVYLEGEVVRGVIDLCLGPLKTYTHKGLRINLFGVRKFSKNKENDCSFIYISKELLAGGVLWQDMRLPFCFEHFDTPYESYYGH